jgi:hypothetical protein
MLMAEDLSYGDMSLAIAALAPSGFVNALTATEEVKLSEKWT